MATHSPTTEQSYQYDFDYFSGAQARVYFGDVWVDDAIRVAFNVQRSKTPIFACNSNYYDTIEDGRELVEGMLAINFKENSYLRIILANIAVRNGTASPIGRTGTGNDPGLTNPLKQTIEQMMNNTTDGGLRNEWERSLVTNLHWVDDWAFEDAAEALENGIFGITTGDSSDTGGGSPYPLTAPKFNILITYGDYNPQVSDTVNHSCVKIVGVVLLGTSQVIESNGQPIVEVYSFLGKRKY